MSNGVLTGATFSDCRTWRYQLWRIWEPEKPSILFIGLNPSTADETQDDPTIRKCIGFAKRWGYGSYLMANLFGFRSTDPAGLKTIDDPVGPGNNAAIKNFIRAAKTVVAAWGCHKGIKSRADEVLAMIPDPQCIRITEGGYPGHPLYIPYTRVLQPYRRRPTR